MRRTRPTCFLDAAQPTLNPGGTGPVPPPSGNEREEADEEGSEAQREELHVAVVPQLALLRHGAADMAAERVAAGRVALDDELALHGQQLTTS